MKSKLALLLASLIFFNIILPTKVFAASVQDQSKPIFGLTADQVVEKYNQLTDQQKDQVLRSLANTSIFANSLFGNIFNSTFGVLDDAVKKVGDLFFQANGVVYKLGSSALAWVSRLIDKVFNNDLSDLNISQPVVDDFYLNTRDLVFVSDVFFTNGHIPSMVISAQNFVNSGNYPQNCEYVYIFNQSSYNSQGGAGISKSQYTANSGSNYIPRLVVDLDENKLFFGRIQLNFDYNAYYYSLPTYNSSYNGYFSTSTYTRNYVCTFYSNEVYDWTGPIQNSESTVPPVLDITSSNYLSVLKNYLNNYFSWADSFVLIHNNTFSLLPISHSSESYELTNNTYYNYIYNVPDQTPLNVYNIVSNTAINYDPVENLIQYLPDNYNIEQNFSVVNNYYISSGSAITGQAIDVNIVSPGVIDVRVINPEDLTQQVTNNVSKDIINNTDVNFGDLDFSPSVTVGLNAAKDSIDGIVPVTGSSIVAQFVSGIPPDWLALGFVFLVLFIVAGFGMSIIRH